VESTLAEEGSPFLPFLSRVLVLAREEDMSAQNKHAHFPADSGMSSAPMGAVHFVNHGGEDALNAESVLPINVEETMAVLTRCSFDESHRQPIASLGGIRAIAELAQVRNRDFSLSSIKTGKNVVPFVCNYITRLLSCFDLFFPFCSSPTKSSSLPRDVPASGDD